jgi:hypothetical protein
MQIYDVLDQNTLYESYDVHPIDLSLRSQCNAPPSVKIINIERRTEEYMAFNDHFRKSFIKPKELMDGVSLYLKNGFEKSRIKVDDQSTKVIQIKMIDVRGSAGGNFYSGFFKMELIIPEKNISKTYEESEASFLDRSGILFQASSYAIHDVTRKIIDDSVIQDYILCK